MENLRANPFVYGYAMGTPSSIGEAFEMVEEERVGEDGKVVIDKKLQRKQQAEKKTMTWGI